MTYLSAVHGGTGKAPYTLGANVRQCPASIDPFQKVDDDALSCKFLKALRYSAPGRMPYSTVVDF